MKLEIKALNKWVVIMWCTSQFILKQSQARYTSKGIECRITK